MNEILSQCISKIVETIGVGHLESVYHHALIVELKKKSVQFDSEKALPIIYEGVFIGTVKPDLIINNSIIVEMKTIAAIGKKEHNQTNKYMRLTGFTEAYIVNVNHHTWDVVRVDPNLQDNLILI
jgi:GxxExxY protein